MSRNSSQLIPGSQIHFNRDFAADFSHSLSNFAKNSMLSGNQTTISSSPLTQFPILPHKEWICIECANLNAKGSYSCKRCGNLIDSPAPSSKEYSAVGRHPYEGHLGSSLSHIDPVVRTPFGILQTFAAPDPKNFIFDASKGYFHDSTTNFYYDRNSDYYFNPKSNKWMFWCSKYSTYIDCSGGDVELKRSLQEEEFDIQQKRTSGKTDDKIPNAPSGSLAVQRRSENIADDWFDLIKRVGAGDLSNPGKSAVTSIANPRSMMRVEESRDSVLAGKEEKDIKGIITSNAQSNLRDCIIQNEKFLIDLHKLLAQERDPLAIQKIQSQIDGFDSTTRSLQTLLEMLSGGGDFVNSQSMNQKPTSSSIITPQLKRHITKLIQSENNNDHNIDDSYFNPNSATLPSRDEKERRRDSKRSSDKSNSALRETILEGKRTAFDEHIEQVEKLRNMIGSKKIGEKRNWVESQSNVSFPRDVAHKETSFEDQIRTIIDQHVEKQWLLNSATDTTKSGRLSPSPQKKDSRRTRSRSRNRNRKSRSRSRKLSPHRRQRSRSRQRSSNRVSGRSRSRSRHRGTFSNNQEERSRHNGNDDDNELEIISHKINRKDRVSPRSPQPPPVVPMAISPPPPGLARRSTDSLEVLFERAHSMLAQGLVGTNLLQKPFDQVNFPGMQNATSDFSKKQGVNSFPCTFPLSTPLRPQVNSITPQSGFGTIPPPNLGSKQFHPSNSNLHWRMPPPYQASGPAAPILRNPGTLPIICDYCGRDGHTLEVCPSLPKTVHTQDQRVIRNELECTEITNKIADKDAALGLCLNCGRFGHSQLGCLLPRITDAELQKKIRKAEDRQRLQQLDKLKMKRKAEKYTVRRNDPLIQRLRSVAPHGKITKDHIRLICQRCGGLGHIWNECARPEVPRSTLKSINEKMEEFIKIFFVHLNDDNLVDFSEKFELFIIMDGIENNGTVDPVGLQLQSSCNRGIVTKGDLRDLCKNCATIGHSPADCRQKTICSRQHYEKMLKLVDAYRALVKEGNGNFFLPRLNQSQNQKNPHTSNININNTYSTTIRRVTKEPEIVLVDSDDEESKDKRKNNRKK